MVLVYNPKLATVTVNGQYITGFSEDQMVTIEKNEDNVMPKIGVDGVVSYGINLDGSATVNLTLMQTSPSLPLFRDLAKSRETFTLAITDMNDNAESHAMNDCIILKSMDENTGYKEPDEVEVPIFVPYFEDLRAR